MDLVFLAPAATRPIGGVMAIHEFANAMSRRGHGVTIAHLHAEGERPTEVDDTYWTSFEPTVHHRYVEERADLGPSANLGPSDFVFYFNSRRVRTSGLPLMWVQGLGMFDRAAETEIVSAAMPKLCISQWLRNVLLSIGVPASQTRYLPYGLDHAVYRPGPPSRDRRPVISMLCNPHITKGAAIGVDALRLVAKTHPIEVELFGTYGAPDELPASFVFHDHIQGPGLADLYRRSLIFLTSALVEGFGFAPIEAMACGAALVASENGGCDDYAIHEDTALIGRGYGPDVLADQIRRLLDDRDLCAAVAARGQAYCAIFEWDRSAECLEAILLDYAAHPDEGRQEHAISLPSGRDMLVQLRGALPSGLSWTS